MNTLPLDTRAVEAFLATLMVNLGFGLLAPGNTFDNPNYDLIKYVPDWPIGLVLISVGLTRWFAVLYAVTLPSWLRIFGAFFGLNFWLATAFIIFYSVTRSVPGMFAVATTAAAFEVFTTMKVWLEVKRRRQATDDRGNS